MRVFKHELNLICHAFCFHLRHIPRWLDQFIYSDWLNCLCGRTIMLPSISFCLNKINIRGIRNIYTALFVTIQTESEGERDGPWSISSDYTNCFVVGGWGNTQNNRDFHWISRIGVDLTVSYRGWGQAFHHNPHTMTSSVELHTTTKTIERAMILECKQNHSLTRVRSLEKSAAAERNHGDESIFSIIIIQVGTLFQPYLLRSMQLSRIETKQ